MIGYYRPSQPKGKVSMAQQLKINDEADLKDAIYSKALLKIKNLSFKNSTIKDTSFKLLEQIEVPLPTLQLDLSENFSFVTDATVEFLCTLRCFPELRRLNLADNQIGDDSLVLLSRCHWIMKLEELVLYGNTNISGQGVAILAQSPHMRHLCLLDLHATSVDDQGMERLFRTEVCSKLTTLNLGMNWKRITNKTLYALGHSQFCTDLRILNLEDCQIGDVGIEQLSQSENSGKLIELNLNNSIKKEGNILTDRSLSCIAFSKYLINLQSLELRNSQVTAKGLKTLAVSLACEKIQKLRLSHCSLIKVEALHYLQTIASYQSLSKLYLNNTDIAQSELQTFESTNPQINVIY